MKNKSLFFLVTLLLGGGIIALLNIKLNSEGGEDVQLKRSYETYDTLEIQIDSIEKKGWNRFEYDKLKSEINQDASKGLINVKDKIALLESLEVVYIQMLNKSAEDYFIKGKSTGLTQIYAELARYDKKPDYKGQVTRMYEVVSRYFQFVKMTASMGALIKNQIDDAQNKALSDQIDFYASQEYLNQSSHVKQLQNAFKNELRDFQVIATDFELSMQRKCDCDRLYSKYDYYLSECKRIQAEKFPEPINY
jgi:pyruvate/2-oxoacid:ferredoxin oxidoreductase beta subunit